MDDFIAQFNGASVDYDHVYGSQCVDLIKVWCDHLGLPIPHGNACDYKQNASDKLVWVTNTPTGVPQKGDVMVWDTSIGAYGHVAIFVDGNVNSFTSFDQNWPVGSACHLQSHNYKGVIGWLHPVTQVTPVEKDAVQFEGNDRVYLWAQNPQVATAWYGSDWSKYVRIITPQIVKEIVENPLNIQMKKELDDMRILYRVDMEIRDGEIRDLEAKIKALGLTPEEVQVLSFWDKIKQFIRRFK